MTRKSYKLIAESIKSQMDTIEALYNVAGEQGIRGAKIAIREYTDNLTTILKLDDSNFDRDKFLTACGF